MRVRRFIGSLIATTLAATTLGVITSATPVSAATATKIVGGSKGWIYRGYKTQPGGIAYGDTLYFDIDVKATDGSTDPYDGTITIQRQLSGSSTWTTIATSTYAGYYGSTKAVKSAAYRAIYSGSAQYGWAASGVTSSIKVQRAIKIANKGKRRVLLVGKVSPKYHGKVIIQKKRGKHWRNWKGVRTNRKGVFKSYLPAPRHGRYYWRIRIKASHGFVRSAYGTFYTYKY